MKIAAFSGVFVQTPAPLDSLSVIMRRSVTAEWCCRGAGAWQKRKRPAMCCVLCAAQQCRCRTISMQARLRRLWPLLQPRTAALWLEVH